MENERPKISALVTTYNEERNIEDCLKSIMWADEVVVVDSYSTDKTVEIIKGFPQVKFYQRPYYGAASQKNWAMDKTIHPWIFIIDADERVTPELKEEILKTIENPKFNSYYIRRVAYFMDKPLKFSGWQHDRVVRLIKRGAGRYPNKRVHADMKVEGETGYLKYALIHYMIDSFEQYLPRIVTYGFWAAAQGWRVNKKSGFFEIFLRSFWRFIRMYFIQLGFLDGLHGLVFCMLQSFGTYLKWAILWEWRENAKRGRLPNLPEFDEDEKVWKKKE